MGKKPRIVFAKAFMFALTPCVFVSHFWYGWDIEFMWGFWSMIIGADPQRHEQYRAH